jgi:non-canonical purine NTP pyrophosphatase (RdgB/HAM1 family)
MSVRKIYFVSSNEEKYREIQGALADSGVLIERLALDLPEIQSVDPVEVAAYKARKAYASVGDEVLVEDSALGITAWNGYPGALIKWLTRAVGEAGLCRQLDAWEDRRAVAIAVFCLFDGKDLRTFVGQVQGQIPRQPRGENGFGWDSIFQPEDSTLTYGEIARETKMRISMRARALDALRTYLQGS